MCAHTRVAELLKKKVTAHTQRHPIASTLGKLPVPRHTNCNPTGTYNSELVIIAMIQARAKCNTSLTTIAIAIALIIRSTRLDGKLHQYQVRCM